MKYPHPHGHTAHRNWIAAILAATFATSLAACAGGPGGPGGPGGGGGIIATNAPAAGFENMRGGSEEDFMLNVGRRTYFTENSAELNDTARTTLDKQAQWLRSNQSWLVKIQGFADDPGNEQANIDISQQRADAVMAYLVSQGVPQNRMWAKGYGTERLIRDCEDLKCKSQNRRVISNLREEFDASAS